ncbi:hypothetical protein [Rhizobium sp. RAF56]|uniref:hypothetical protein n=1 Tax=Rhizobium sp. RAF56 TaxID=3233062 RepID=UPI003F95868B
MRAGLRAAITLRMLCAVAILFLGLGHQPPEMRERGGYSAAAYVLPDGTEASLCVTVTDDSGKPIAAFKPNCEVCRLSASVILPTPDTGAWVVHDFASLRNPPKTVPVLFVPRAVERPNSRAPPALV